MEAQEEKLLKAIEEAKGTKTPAVSKDKSHAPGSAEFAAAADSANTANDAGTVSEPQSEPATRRGSAAGGGGAAVAAVKKRDHGSTASTSAGTGTGGDEESIMGAELFSAFSELEAARAGVIAAATALNNAEAKVRSSVCGKISDMKRGQQAKMKLMLANMMDKMLNQDDD